MRRYDAVINQLLEFAETHSDVRAVMLNGSRVNANVVQDIMQDYDVVFFIKQFQQMRYRQNRDWIHQFGKLVIYQQNASDDGSYIFLLQFQDGVRIDLRFCDIQTIEKVVGEDTLSKILMDKDNLIEHFPQPSDQKYWVKMPAEKEWNALLNELWWIQTYVAKGLWRKELPYAKYMYDVILMNAIRQLLSWQIGFGHQWQINVGKCGKFFARLLPDDVYERFIRLYASGDYAEIWDKLFEAGKLIRDIGRELGENLGYKYPLKDDRNVTDFIERIRLTPRDAGHIVANNS